MEMSCNGLYLTVIAGIHTVPNSTVHVQSGTHRYSTCSDSTPSLQPMSSLHPISTTNVQTVPNVFSPCSASSIFTTHGQRLCHLYSTPPDKTPYLQYFYCPASTPYLHHIYSQSTHHLSCLCPVSTQSLLSTSSQYTISSAHYQ